MTGQTRLAALISAIGADVKALQTAGGGSIPTPNPAIEVLATDFLTTVNPFDVVTQEGDGTVVISSAGGVTGNGMTITATANASSRANVQQVLGARNISAKIVADWRVRTAGAGGSNVPFARFFQGSQRLMDVYRDNTSGDVWIRTTDAGGTFDYINTGFTLALNTWCRVAMAYNVVTGVILVIINGVVEYEGILADRWAATAIDKVYVGAEHVNQVGVFDVDNLILLAEDDVVVERTPDQHNVSTSAQSNTFNNDLYLAGSNVPIPQGKIKVGTKYRCKFNVVKTAAGTQTPVISVRVGTAGAIGDTSRTTMTFAAQSAAADEGVFEVELVFRASGATAIIQALGVLGHRLAATGLSSSNNSVAINTSAAFDVTGAGLQIGLSVNAGSASSWTVSLVSAELVNLA